MWANRIEGLRRRTLLEHEHQLMLGAIERPHAANILVPNAQILDFPIDGPAGAEDFKGMAPIHAEVMQGAIHAEVGHMPKGGAKEAGDRDPAPQRRRAKD